MARPIAKPPTKRGRAVIAWLRANDHSIASAAKLAGVDRCVVARTVHNDSELHACSVASLIRPPLSMPIELASPALADALRGLGVLPSTAATTAKQDSVTA